MKEKKFALNSRLRSMRSDYSKNSLLEHECDPDPLVQFGEWLRVALEKDAIYGNAMCLSTLDQNGMPDARTVLLRNISYGGLTFFTRYNSAKGIQLAAHTKACLHFFWKELERQVKIQGEVRFLPAGESDLYFRSRPFESKVSACLACLNESAGSRESLDSRYEELLKQYKGSEVPRPSEWGGYVLLPSVFEFWQGRKSRLHDRIRYTQQPGGTWDLERLMP